MPWFVTFTDFVFTKWTPCCPTCCLLLCHGLWHCFECNERLLECFAWVLNSTMSIVSESNSLCSALHNIHALRSLFSVVARLILPCILKSKTTAFLLVSHKDTPQLVMQNTNQKQTDVCCLWFRLYDKHCFGGRCTQWLLYPQVSSARVLKGLEHEFKDHMKYTRMPL